MPSLSAVWSVRVAPSDHGKLFAISTLAVGVGTTIGTYGFSNFLFTNGPDDTSLQLSYGWFLGAVLEILVLLANLFAYLVYIVPERHLPNRFQSLGALTA